MSRLQQLRIMTRIARFLRPCEIIFGLLPGSNQFRTYSLIVLMSALPVVVQGAGKDLRSQLEELATKHEFIIQGLNRIGNEPAKEVSGQAPEQLKILLQEYNHVILQDGSGDIEKVLIYSLKRSDAYSLKRSDAEPAQGYRANMTRRGRHHVVKAVLVGPTGARRTESLIVDTGASVIVLPQSMTKALGFQENGLRDGWSQTANGRVRTKRGVLRSVQIGQVVVENVAVNFIENEALGGNSLLGMSFLGRFRFTLDGDNNQLILLEK